MALEAAAHDIFRERELLRLARRRVVEARRGGAALGDARGQRHVGNAHGGQQHLRKAADVDGVVGRERLRRGYGARAPAQLAVVVVLDEQAALARPRGERLPPRVGAREGLGWTLRRNFKKKLRAAAYRGLGALRARHAPAAVAQYPLALFEAGRCDGGASGRSEGAAQEKQKLLRAGGDDDVLRLAPHAARAVGIGGERAPQLRLAARVAARGYLAPPLERGAHAASPRFGVRGLRVYRAAAEIESRRLFLRLAERAQISRRRLAARDEAAALRHALSAPLDDEPRVCVLDRRTAHGERGGKLAHRRQPRARGERTALRRIRERAVNLLPHWRF